MPKLLVDTAPAQAQLPVQPVEQPILGSPYEEPVAHWVYRDGSAEQMRGRRRAGYWWKRERTSHGQVGMFEEEQFDELPLVNALREDVRQWRAGGYENATPVTKELLRHWASEDRPRRLFFCQREAVETIIYLAEIRLRPNPATPARRTRFAPAFAEADFDRLLDQPADPAAPALRRLGCKMATGSGKTVVMAMLVAWALCNRGRQPADERFPAAVLVCCPNLTVRERLQVLRPEHANNYYAAFDLVPLHLRSHLQQGRVLVLNWHKLAPEGEHVEGGRSYAVVHKGEESDDAFARRVLGDLAERAPLLVLNDEGHHCYRPKVEAGEDDAAAGEEAKAENDEARVWMRGLDRLNAARGVRLCVDLSATPFYIAGSGYPEGAPFPWLVSDFGLVDAIESGIVKIPRLPVNDSTGRPEPVYFRLWQSVNARLGPAERLPGKARKPKPEAVYREAQSALTTLAAQWRERFRLVQEARPGQEVIPPVLIVVCDNTDIAEVFYRQISGERTEEVVADEAEDGDGEEPPAGRRGKRTKTRTVYGQSDVLEEFANAPARRHTLRIDSKLLAKAEGEDPDASREDAAQELRRLVATVGRPGEPGEHLRCVVSVGMLTEGWDANNVTQILGVRAFSSQLLCEQVVGRGLRRMDYAPDPETGKLHEEYVDVYGIPFSVIPFKGRPTQAAAPVDRPLNRVRALPERQQFALRFPVVEGYAFALRHNAIKANLERLPWLQVDPATDPTGVFVEATVGYRVGGGAGTAPGGWALHTREAYYQSTHLQRIEFLIAERIVTALVGAGSQEPERRPDAKLGLQSRHQLFPQVLRIVKQFIATRVDFRGCDPRELGHQRYFQQIVERLLTAIEPNEVHGEAPLLPILNRYQPWGTTADVEFTTTRPCFPTQRSHINQVVADTARWEQSAAFHLEAALDTVACYARNDHLGLLIPYDYLGVHHVYEPDFLVKLRNGRLLLLETKGWQTEDDRQKRAGAERWVQAVNNWLGAEVWALRECRDPQLLPTLLRDLSPVPSPQGEGS